ncbi:protein-cysteine N-palmitoyltransferase HHAT [Belonocnema kinseyi]|uniref:protein-cysteine N-palmitoyltransferase HHAT n=1 Tax=Belonocnema kinseyi TaxID=2817044 RepID=UPI00143D3396|nr:protein-cysteine N-palmitoyltransferase HHAT [Belonocnema kinseyi]
MAREIQNVEIAKFCKFEVFLYFAVWSGSIFYSIYQVHLTEFYFVDYPDTYEDFRPGWSWIGRKMDISDREWRSWIPFMYQLTPWIIVHLIISRIIKGIFLNDPLILSCWFICSSLIFVWNYLGFLGVLLLLIQPCIARLLISLGSEILSWIVHLMILSIIYYEKTYGFIFESWLGVEEEKYYMLTIALCWIQLRSISCSVDCIVNDKEPNTLFGFAKSFLQSTAYCLYLPTLFLGPIILYEDFLHGIKKTPEPWNLRRLVYFFLNLTRYIFWLYFTEFGMHFLYFNALQFFPDVVEKLNPWAFFGMGYCMGQYFLNKYVVVYGIWSLVTKLDDIEAPPHPKCIARIHLYSDMWKHFDRGLYKFLLRYIYIPTSGSKSGARKLFSSFLCFSFVFLWHGMELFIFIWSFLNFFGLAVEYFASAIGKSRKYLSITEKYLSGRNIRRLNCIFASPLLAMSAISNFYFFAGADVGHIYIRRVLFLDSWFTIFLLLFCLYCCCQVSLEMKQFEKVKENRCKSI